MLEHLVDFGMPVIPSVEVLASMIRRPTFTQKVKSAFTSSKSLTEGLESLVSSLENKSPLDATLMWKDTAALDSANNCLLEVVERLDCLMDNEGNIVDSRVLGTVFATCSVQGSAEAAVSFKTTFPVNDYCLHKEAVLANSVEQFKNAGTVRFFPKGAAIELMRYTVENPPISLPFSISYDLLAKPVSSVV